MSDISRSDTDRESVNFAGADGARIDAWLYRPDPDIATHVWCSTTATSGRRRDRLASC